MRKRTNWFTISYWDRICIVEANHPSFGYHPSCQVLASIMLITLIEVQTKRGVPNDCQMCHHCLQDSRFQVQLLLVDITHCPRERVRFFHRRNNCAYLKSMYYHLKRLNVVGASTWQTGGHSLNVQYVKA
jgi:hypothetical protein